MDNQNKVNPNHMTSICEGFNYCYEGIYDNATDRYLMLDYSFCDVINWYWGNRV